MLDLSSITLMCVDTRAPDLATWAINRCLAHARFAEVVLMTDLARLSTRQEEITYVQAPPIRKKKDYSRLMLTGIGQHVVGSHVLIIQWDGFILRPDLWDPSFLDYDYIGAVWQQFPQTPIGNGGFSLRSRRLLDAMQQPEIVIEHPEDTCIGVTNRRCLEENYGIHFASVEVAERFSVERTPWHAAFGFHGFSNFAKVLSADELQAFLDNVPGSCCSGDESFDLVHELIECGLNRQARELFAKMRFSIRRARQYMEIWRALR